MTKKKTSGSWSYKRKVDPGRDPTGSQILQRSGTVGAPRKVRKKKATKKKAAKKKTTKKAARKKAKKKASKKPARKKVVRKKKR